MMEHAILGAYCNPISHFGSEEIPADVPWEAAWPSLQRGW